MLTNKDFCDYETCVALVELGTRITSRKVYSDRNTLKHSSRGITYTVRAASAMGWVIAIPLYEAQKFLREKKGIHIAPRIYLYHDINLDEQTSWECTIYVEWSAIYTIGKSLTYEDALLLGIKEAVKILKENETIHE